MRIIGKTYKKAAQTPPAEVKENAPAQPPETSEQKAEAKAEAEKKAKK